MEIENMKDFTAVVVRHVTEFMQSGRVEEVIAQSIEKTVTSVIEHELRQYSEFGKRLEKAVAEALKIQDIDNLPVYNDLILKIVRRQVEHLTNDIVQKQVAENLESLLKPAPESIKLSVLFEQYKDHLTSKIDAWESRKMMFRLKDADTYSDSFKYLELSEDDNDRTPDMCIGLHIKDTKNEPNIATVYYLRFGGQDLEKQLFVGGMYDFERSVFQMKAAGTKVELDIDHYDVCREYGAVID